MKSSASNPTLFLRHAAVALVLVATFIAMDRSTIALQILPVISAWYLTAALALAALLDIGFWYMPILCVAAWLSFSINYHLHASFWNIASIVLGTGVYTLGAWLLRDGLHLDLRLLRLRDVLWFTLVALPAAVGAAAGGVLMAVMNGDVARHLYPRTVFTWSLGNAVAIVSITPFLLQFVFPSVRKFLGKEADAEGSNVVVRTERVTPWGYLEVLAQVVSVPLALWVAFGFTGGRFLYVCFIPVIWIAVRRGLRGTTVALLATNIGAVAAFHFLHPATASLTDLLCLMLAVAVTGLLLGALFEERKIGDQALREAEARFRSLVEQSLVGIYILEGPEATLTYANPVAAAIFGYTQAEVLGMRATDFAIESDRPMMVDNIRRRTKGEAPDVRYAFKGRHKSGAVLDIEVHGVRTDFAGKPAILGVILDITERKRAEHALREAEEKYREIFDNAVVGIFQTTPDGRYLSANRALARMYGFGSPEELIAANIDIGNQVYVDPTHREKFKRLLEEKGILRDFVIEIYRKDGTHGWVVENSRAVRDASGKVIYYEGTQQDITERKNLEAQYEQAQKMEAVGRLAGGVAHDFNNILSVIMGYADISKDLLEEDHPVSRNISQIKRAAERAASLTRQLLTFSRKQVVFPRVLDLNKVVDNLTEMLRRLVGEDVAISFAPGEALDLVKVDPGQIEQILMNLGVNSRDAMPSGGKIIIATKNVTLDEGYVHDHSPVVPGSYVMLSFGDTGSGIGEENLSRIFEPFFTTKGSGKGTGLGLATVYGIVKQNNGYIWAYSEPGRGTVLKIYFPRVEAAESVLEPESELHHEGGSETILVVEDEAALRNAVAILLQGGGYKVLKAENAAAALAITESYKGSIDLVLTDVIMPTMSGVELSERLRKLRPELKVLYMSGYAGDQLDHYGQFASEAAFLEKPFTKKSLLRKVRSALGS